MSDDQSQHDQIPESKLIKLEDIFIDEAFNCRSNIAAFDVIELANDIEQNSLMQAVTVMRHNEVERAETGKDFCLIAGFRRSKAYEVKGWTEIPCAIKPWMEPMRRKLMNLSENIQRSQLNIMEEARALQHLKDMKVPRETIAKELKMSGKWVQIRLYLLDLPLEIQEEAQAGLLNQIQIMDIRSLTNDEDRFEAVRKIKECKARGEKPPKINPKVPTKGAKKHRSRTLINDRMEELIGLGVTPGIWSRVMAWCSGEITDVDLFDSIYHDCKEREIDFIIPHKYQAD